MAVTRKFEGLPDIDASAPDVYETPELTDDVSTLRETSAQSPSEGSDAEDGVSPTDDDGSRIDRHRWKAGQARTRFQASRVNAGNVDFSDRLNLNQRSYRTYNGRRRSGHFDDDPEELGDFSDEEDESLERKLARIYREVEQIRIAVEESNDGEASKKTDQEQHPLEQVEKISESLDAIYAKRRGITRGAEADFAKTVRAFAKDNNDQQDSKTSIDQTFKAMSSGSTQSLETIIRVADFDTRLTIIEKAMGLTGANLPDSSDGESKPILPTLETLERLIGTAMAQPGQLEPIQLKTRQLLKDVEKYSRLRADTPETNGTNTPTTNGQHTEEKSVAFGQAAKLNALYGVLPTIDSLSPSLPLLLDRLRTLRLLHASAADANTEVNGVIERQDEQAEEIKQWREALDKLEESQKEGDSAMVENVEKISERIKELETSLDKE